ncbi:MAG: hypothetical protein HKM24_01330 [Gammaproteobacteria bacterium]|nr:hypothetical protein [Gammaproteobacteria bacterium]
MPRTLVILLTFLITTVLLSISRADGPCDFMFGMWGFADKNAHADVKKDYKDDYVRFFTSSETDGSDQGVFGVESLEESVCIRKNYDMYSVTTSEPGEQCEVQDLVDSYHAYAEKYNRRMKKLLLKEGKYLCE